MDENTGYASNKINRFIIYLGRDAMELEFKKYDAITMLFRHGLNAYESPAERRKTIPTILFERSLRSLYCQLLFLFHNGELAINANDEFAIFLLCYNVPVVLWTWLFLCYIRWKTILHLYILSYPYRVVHTKRKSVFVVFEVI